MSVDVMSLVVFRLDDRRYALPVSVAERVVRSVEVTPLPGAPTTVLGVINVEGRLFPVFNMRRRLGLPERDVRPADWFVLAAASHRNVVVVVDESEGIIEQPLADVVRSAQITPGLSQFPGVTTLDGDVLLIYDLDAFLSLDDAQRLDLAIADAGGEL